MPLFGRLFCFLRQSLMTSTDASYFCVDASSDAPTQGTILRFAVGVTWIKPWQCLLRPLLRHESVCNIYIDVDDTKCSSIDSSTPPEGIYPGCQTQQALEAPAYHMEGYPPCYEHNLSMRFSLLTYREAKTDFLVDVYSCASIGTL